MNLKTHRTVIADSSPLILLGNTGYLYILKELYEEIFIPKAVYDEVTHKSDDASYIIGQSDWIRVCCIVDRVRVDAFPEGLHLGEREAILLYEDLDADTIILDDMSAREEAKRRKQNIIGLAGILLKAKEQKIIPAVKPIIELFISHKYYLDDETIKNIYELANEL